VIGVIRMNFYMGSNIFLLDMEKQVINIIKYDEAGVVK